MLRLKVSVISPSLRVLYNVTWLTTEMELINENLATCIYPVSENEGSTTNLFSHVKLNNPIEHNVSIIKTTKTVSYNHEETENSSVGDEICSDKINSAAFKEKPKILLVFQSISSSIEKQCTTILLKFI
ncbi:hypothetical protein CEXT_41451 [Caerostris extrusa]|uniref:Uncharacterized protein n=1 Tax=Caerostris extrusa TaxID=172846 RepID=A0AAV4XYV4_CAEEX|nr:hypothetical protein CEXT_41451 [Caerostris extrusa]